MVKVWKPEWVQHVSQAHNDLYGNDMGKERRSPIMSISIQPGGKRFATGGQDGKVKIWNLRTVVCKTNGEDKQEEGESNSKKVEIIEHEKDEKENQNDQNKLLATLSEHGSSINCVRWSGDGTFLASGSDDCCINLWILSKSPNLIGGNGNISSISSSIGGEKHVNVEDWKSVITFKGHTMDVTYVGWSPDSSLLASCSVDNTVRIWAIEKSWAENMNFRTVVTDVVTVLKGHSGWAKCVAWDPVGTYLATASDDKSVIVWRCSDWQQETAIKEPLSDGSNTTFKRQITWSPDGVFLCLTHAYDAPRNVAYVVERNKWHENESAVRFVGHPKPVSLASFSPAIYRFKQSENARISTVCAIACNDRVLTIWVPGRNRALAVFRNLFKEKILDMTWSDDGYVLMACSLDGHVICMNFTEFKSMPHVGKSLSSREVARILRRHYGDAAFRGNEPTFSETRSQLVLEEIDQQNRIVSSSVNLASNNNRSDTATTAAAAPTPTKAKQIETVTREGKRRITPAFLSGPASTPAPTNKAAYAGTPLGPGMMNTVSPCINNLQGRIKRRRVDIISSSESSVDMKEYRCIINPSSLPEKHSICVERDNGNMTMLQVESSAKLKKQQSSKPISIIKRIRNGNLHWRTKIDGKATAMAGNKNFTAIATSTGELFLFGSAGELLAPPIQLAMKIAHLSVSPSDGQYIMCVLSNAHIYVWDLRSLCATIVNIRIDPLMKLLLPLASTADGDEQPFEPIELGGGLVGLDFLQKVELRQTQKMSKSKLILDIDITLHGVPVIKCIGPLSREPRRQDSLPENGCGTGVINEKECSAYAYSKDLQSWCRISDASRYLHSDYSTTLNFNSLGNKQNRHSENTATHPLGSIQAEMAEAGRLSGIVSSSFCAKVLANAKVEDLSDLEDYSEISRLHLEALIGSCRILFSAEEYQEWILAYANRLTETSDTQRLHALCSSLLGPHAGLDENEDGVPSIYEETGTEEMDEDTFKDSKTSLTSNISDSNVKLPEWKEGERAWKPFILGINKHELLRDKVLPTISRNREMQRLVQEYYKAVATVATKTSSPNTLLENRMK